MTIASTMHEKLSKAFSPDVLEIVDESAKHVGHAGARPGGETHFQVRIVSAAFDGLGRVERQRAIYNVLSDEMTSGVHALSLMALSPTEAGRGH